MTSYRIYRSVLATVIILGTLFGARALAGDFHVEGAFGVARRLVGVNTTFRESNPAISADGLILFFGRRAVAVMAREWEFKLMALRLQLLVALLRRPR